MYQVSLMYANFRLSTQNNLKSCFKQLKTPSKRLHVQVLSSSLQMFFLYMLFSSRFLQKESNEIVEALIQSKVALCKYNFELNFRKFDV